MASNNPSRQELLQENERQRARIDQLEAENEALREEVKNTKMKEAVQEEERPRKRQRTAEHHGENQLVVHNENGGRTDVAHHQEQDQQQVVVARATIVHILPTELLGRALDFLPFSKRRDFSNGSRDLWKRVQVEYETKMMVDLILDSTPTHAFLCGDFSSFCTLNLGSHGSDTILALLSHQRAFPQLKHLAMAGSVNVTDFLPFWRKPKSSFCCRTSICSSSPMDEQRKSKRHGQTSIVEKDRGAS